MKIQYKTLLMSIKQFEKKIIWFCLNFTIDNYLLILAYMWHKARNVEHPMKIQLTMPEEILSFLKESNLFIKM